MSSETASRLLSDTCRGDREAASRLLPMVYDELRRLAARYLREDAGDPVTLQPTAIVHEAYMRLIGREGGDYNSRTHFFAAAAGAMRHVLIDHARARRAIKRGEGERPMTLIETDGVSDRAAGAADLLALNELLVQLAQLNERAARIVDLRVFGGLGIAEVATVLAVSETTVKDDWRFARAWLRSELRRGEDS